MAVLLPNSCFVHIPKCGGTSVRLALKQARLSLDIGEAGPDLSPPQYSKHMRTRNVRRFTDKPIFTFIRSKPQWYISVYLHRRSTGQWPMLDENDKTMYLPWLPGDQVDDFNVWAQRLIEVRPHFLDRYYQEYTEGADYVGRVEYLEEDLDRILNKLEGRSISRPMSRENPDPAYNIHMEVETYKMIQANG